VLLFRGIALLFLAIGIVVVPLGSTTGAGAAGRPPRPAVSHRSTALPVGTIAYTRNYSELHLVQPDATNDLIIWTEPSGSSLLQPSWRTDSAEVAFASTHEQTASLYQSDIYGIHPDGTGIRRITNYPDVSQLGGYPTGTVQVTISNYDLAGGPYFVYMEGAPANAVQETVVTMGSPVTLTFTNVAVFPNATQYPVVVNGLSRWIYPPSGVTVQAGKSVSTVVQISSTTNLESWGAFNPAWRTDGAELDYALGSLCLGSSSPTNPSPGTFTTLLLTASASMCTFDRGPTTGLANQILYWDNLNTTTGAGIYQVTEGSATAGTLVLAIESANFVYGLRWLPDGSGFIYAQTSGYSTSDIFEYDFASQTPRQLTSFAGNQNEYAGYLTLSPDSSTIVFEYATVDLNPILNPNASADLWIMPRDGSSPPSLFVANGRYPSWSRSTPPPPLQPRFYLPFVSN
jgi:Tol biopolymer transport system component